MYSRATSYATYLHRNMKFIPVRVCAIIMTFMFNMKVRNYLGIYLEDLRGTYTVLCCKYKFNWFDQDCKVAQVAGPAALRGETPAYVDDEVDDISLPLAVLLLAARNRPNCCCCGGNNVHISVPYPIPIPTYNPMISLKSSDDKYNEETVKVRLRNGGSGSNSATGAAAATGGSPVASGKASSQATQIINIHTGDCDCGVEAEDSKHEPRM